MKNFDITTPEGRLELYKDMLRFYKKGMFHSFYTNFCRVLFESYDIYVYKTMREDLPELYAMKPRVNYFGLWYSVNDTASRISLLEELIQKMT